jgi:hypothetical protein
MSVFQASGGDIAVGAGSRRCAVGGASTGVLKAVGKASDCVICEVSHFATL